MHWQQLQAALPLPLPPLAGPALEQSLLPPLPPLLLVALAGL